jgi:hypothetical protein
MRSDGHASKPRHWETGIAKYFSHSQFASAGFHCRGVVVGNPESACGVGSRNRRPVAESENPIYLQLALRFHNGMCRRFRRFEMHRDGAVTPRIFQLMTPVRDKHDFDTQFLGGLAEAARLVAQLACEQQ